MVDVFDKDNNPLEGYMSPEDVNARVEESKVEATKEIDAKIDEVKDEFAEKMKVKDDEIGRLKDELDSDLSDEDKNWKKTRQAIKDLKQDKIDMQEKFDRKIDEIKGDIGDSKIESRIRRISKGDKDLEDRIAVHYNSFGGKPKNEKENQERLKNATLLAGGTDSETVLDGGVVRTGGGNIPVGTELGGKLKDKEAKGVGNKMGITDEELKENELI